jgi:hypothetical protein
MFSSIFWVLRPRQEQPPTNTAIGILNTSVFFVTVPECGQFHLWLDFRIEKLTVPPTSVTIARQILAIFGFSKLVV